MTGMRALIRTRRSGGFLAAGVACLLAFQALIASVGLGMSAASAFGQPKFEICGATAAHSLDAPEHNDTDPAGHRPQCPYCFVAAQCASQPAMVADVKAPAFAVRDVAASPYAGVNHRAVHGRLHRTTGDPRGPPSFPVCYTASAGNQGTLGGLVEVSRRFAQVLKSALERQRLCSGDPVCADHDPATAADDRTLHGAACHGCLVIAETSCEARNLFLDRALLVDTVGPSGVGFFSGS
jgi:hypothetical protein